VVAGREAGTKNTASRKPVPLDPELATALVAWRDAAKFMAPTDFLFPGDTGGPRWQGMISKQHIQPAATAAEISGRVGWHTFRHSYRAWLKRAGTPVEVQKELMRHSNIKTTLEIYGLEPDVTPANSEANSGIVKMLMEN
jgi:integrase